MEMNIGYKCPECNQDNTIKIGQADFDKGKKDFACDACGFENSVEINADAGEIEVDADRLCEIAKKLCNWLESEKVEPIEAYAVMTNLTGILEEKHGFASQRRSDA